jgi:hypothetical protein
MKRAVSLPKPRAEEAHAQSVEPSDRIADAARNRAAVRNRVSAVERISSRRGMNG